jgi:hypothetical protein
MSDLPPAVENYFRKRHKDLSKLDHMPKTKHAFKSLTPDQLAAIDMLNTLGEALEGEGESELTPEDRLQNYVYAIH